MVDFVLIRQGEKVVRFDDFADLGQALAVPQWLAVRIVVFEGGEVFFGDRDAVCVNPFETLFFQKLV